MKSIEIKVDTDGKILIEGVGFTGKECDAKMAAFEKELGSVTARRNSPEYLQPAKANNQQKAGA